MKSRMRIIPVMLWAPSRSLLSTSGNATPMDPPKWPTGTPSAQCATYPPTHAHTDPCVPQGVDKNKVWQMAGEHVENAGLNAWMSSKKEAANSGFRTTFGKTKGGCQLLAWFLQVKEKAYKLKNSTTRDSKKCRSDVFIGLRKPQSA